MLLNADHFGESDSHPVAIFAALKHPVEDESIRHD